MCSLLVPDWLYKINFMYSFFIQVTKLYAGNLPSWFTGNSVKVAMFHSQELRRSLISILMRRLSISTACRRLFALLSSPVNSLITSFCSSLSRNRSVCRFSISSFCSNWSARISSTLSECENCLFSSSSSLADNSFTCCFSDAWLLPRNLGSFWVSETLCLTLYLYVKIFLHKSTYAFDINIDQDLKCILSFHCGTKRAPTLK